VAKKDGMQAFPNPGAGMPQQPTYLYADFNSEAKLNYLRIPVLAKFGYTFKESSFRIYADAGNTGAATIVLGYSYWINSGNKPH
jgi:hypothetical protein